MSLVHKDKRRSLYECSIGDCTIKYLIAIKNCVVGNHFHKKHIEAFVLLTGRAYAKIGEKKALRMKRHREIIVKPKIKHTFTLNKGSVLLELANKKYDPEDDYK